MEKYILFAGRKVPINTNYDVIRFDGEGNPSFYEPGRTLSPERLMQMSMIRPTMQNYSFRYERGASFNRTLEQLFAIQRDEVEAVGQHITQIAFHHDVTSKALDDRLAGASIHTEVFGSDHCPVELDIESSCG